jgi:uncharacterized protein (TIGR00106 family)
MSFMAFVSMTPLGQGESVSEHVVKVVDTIAQSGKPYAVTPMGTIIEGETWDDVMDVLKKGFENMKLECARISISIKIDYRRNKGGRMKTKIASLEDRLDKNLNKIS